jgi:hypothetical protein
VAMLTLHLLQISLVVKFRRTQCSHQKPSARSGEICYNIAHGTYQPPTQRRF